MLRQFPTVKASAAYEIQTAGYGAEQRHRPGRRGQPGQPLGLEQVRVRAERHRRPQPAAASSATSIDPPTGSHFYVLNPTVSGPIIKDRLWYSANVEFLTRKTGRERDAEGILPDPLPELRNWYKGTVKLTWQVTPRNKLQQRDQLRRVLAVQHADGPRLRRRRPGPDRLAQVLHRPDLGVAADRHDRVPQPGRPRQHHQRRLPRPLPGRARSTATTSRRSSRRFPPQHDPATTPPSHDAQRRLHRSSSSTGWSSSATARRWASTTSSSRTTSSPRATINRRSVPGDHDLSSSTGPPDGR